MHEYKTALRWNGGSEATSTATGRTPLTITPPPEFGGTEHQWNPELLLVGAIESCLLLTALSVLARQKVVLKSYSSESKGLMDKTAEGLRFAGMEVLIRLEPANEADVEKAKKSVEIAERYCPVSNAVKFPVKVSVEIGG